MLERNSRSLRKLYMDYSRLMMPHTPKHRILMHSHMKLHQRAAHSLHHYSREPVGENYLQSHKVNCQEDFAPFKAGRQSHLT